MSHYNLSGYVMNGKKEYIHRLIAEKHLGRKLKDSECVHHFDYDKSNNKPENLLVCTLDYHNLIHARTDAYNAGYDPNTHKWCSNCQDYHHKSSFSPGNGYMNLTNICKKSKNERRNKKKKELRGVSK